MIFLTRWQSPLAESARARSKRGSKQILKARVPIHQQIARYESIKVPIFMKIRLERDHDIH